MRRTASVGVSIILIASACGSDDESADRDTSSAIETRASEAPSEEAATADFQATDTAADDEAGAEPGETDVDTSDTTTTTSTTTTVTEPTDPTDEAILKTTVEEYVAAFGNGDPDAAMSLLSERCTDTIPMDEYRASVAAAGELYPGLVVNEFFDVVLDGDVAVVYYATDPEVETEDGERWIIESGAWVWDDC